MKIRLFSFALPLLGVCGALLALYGPQYHAAFCAGLAGFSA